jgi:hypothetical protein
MVSRVGKKDIVQASKHFLPGPFLLETLRNSDREPVGRAGIKAAGKSNKNQSITTNQEPSEWSPDEQRFVHDFAHAIVLPTLADRYQRFTPSELSA